MPGRKLAKKATQGTKRKKKVQQRIRRKIKRKQQAKRPSWVAAIRKKYKIKNKDDQKRSKDKNNDGEEEEGREIEEEVDENAQKKLNEIQPLDTQLFLKGLPPDVDSETIESFFQSFGKVKRVLLVRNKVTKMSSGSCFLHFWKPAAADAVFTFAQQNARDLASTTREGLKQQAEGLSHHQEKKLKYKLNTDVAKVRDPFVMIQSSRVTVHRALSRTDSQELTGSMLKKKKRTKVAADDPRNLYLLQEGLIDPESRAADGLNPKYLQMLANDYETRKLQLRNVNMFVSKNRLSVRNIPKETTPKEFRALFLSAANEYYKAHRKEMDKTKWSKHHGPIRNVKVITDSLGASRGFGFVEFVDPGPALHALRKYNNNPTLFGKNRRLIISFAVENRNAVQKLQRIKELKKSRLQNKQTDPSFEEEE